jgi:hypothetical protein
VTSETYARFLESARGRLQAGDTASLVLELSEFDFYGDVDSAWDDLKFDFEEYKAFRRAALVGDQKWISWFARLLEPLARAEEKQFAADQLEAAVAWAKE